MRRSALFVAKWMAFAGGAVLIALIALTTISVAGRGLGTLAYSDFVAAWLPGAGEWASSIGIGPVTGDFELVEMGVAFAILAFFPWCQMVDGHARVDLLKNVLPKRLEKTLPLLWEAVFVCALILIAWRLYAGMQDKIRYGETTFMLQAPIWWGYALCVLAAAAASFVAICSVLLGIDELRTPRRAEGASADGAGSGKAIRAEGDRSTRADGSSVCDTSVSDAGAGGDPDARADGGKAEETSK